MNSATVLQFVADWLTGELGELGFVHRPNDEYVVRRMPQGRQDVGIAVWDRSRGVELSLILSVRIDAVEAMYHRFSGVLPEFQALSSTVVTPFHYFAGGPERTTVATVEELAAVTQNWEQPLRNEVIPYFKEVVDVVSLDHLVNTTNDILDVTNLLDSYIHKIILAKVAGNPKLSTLVELHRPVLDALDSDSSMYDTVLEYLVRQ